MVDLNQDGVDDAEQINTCLLAKGLRFTACAWRASVKAVSGVKTLVFAGGLYVVGLADQLDAIDAMGFLQRLAGDNAKVGSYLLVIGIVVALLRFVTKEPVPGTAVAANANDGETV